LVLLREMGAGQAQGYYFAKPMGLEDLLGAKDSEQQDGITQVSALWRRSFTNPHQPDYL
jgi:predicted signal transduction protein with EAL and GGDEF domain